MRGAGRSGAHRQALRVPGYSDSTYTDQIGWDRDTCNRNGIGRTATQGSFSVYEQTEPYAMCINGQLAPY